MAGDWGRQPQIDKNNVVRGVFFEHFLRWAGIVRNFRNFQGLVWPQCRCESVPNTGCRAAFSGDAREARGFPPLRVVSPTACCLW